MVRFWENWKKNYDFMAEIFETNENKKQGTTRIFPIFRLQQTLVDIIRCHSHRKKIHKVQSHMWIYCMYTRSKKGSAKDKILSKL